MCCDWSAVDKSECSVDVVVDVSWSSRNPELPEEGFALSGLVQGLWVGFVDVSCDGVSPLENVGFVLDGPQSALDSRDFHPFTVGGNENGSKQTSGVFEEVFS